MISLFAIALLASCAAGKYTVTHDFPAEMSETVRADYIRQWEKGKVLYGLTCAKCHNTIEGKHEIIPDFSQEKLTGYELRVQNDRHEMGISETTVSAEDLVLITIFLTYKKKNAKT
jgi:hypothetical protein